jgi:hypothetical protein
VPCAAISLFFFSVKGCNAITRPQRTLPCSLFLFLRKTVVTPTYMRQCTRVVLPNKVSMRVPLCVRAHWHVCICISYCFSRVCVYVRLLHWLLLLGFLCCLAIACTVRRTSICVCHINGT